MSNIITQAIAKAALGLRDLKADKTNTYSKYEYISADQILNRAGSELSKNGLSIVPQIASHSVVEQPKFSGGFRYMATVQMIFSVMHESDPGNSLECNWFGIGEDSGTPDKAFYKAITSGHKYFLSKLLMIGEGNEDGEHEPLSENMQPKGKQEPKSTLSTPQTTSEKIMNSEASDFWSIALDAIPRYDHNNAIKATAKKLGYTALSGVPSERVKMFESIRDYAEMRDKGMPDQLAVSAINGEITIKEAWEQVAKKGASPADVKAINKDLFGEDADAKPAGNNYATE